MSTNTQQDLIGQRVITAAGGSNRAVVYGGACAYGGEQWIFGGETRIETSFDRVAPADTPIPDKDARVAATKRTTKEARDAGHYGRGSWSYTIEGYPRTLWADTKRDALADGDDPLQADLTPPFGKRLVDHCHLEDSDEFGEMSLVGHPVGPRRLVHNLKGWSAQLERRSRSLGVGAELVGQLGEQVFLGLVVVVERCRRTFRCGGNVADRHAQEAFLRDHLLGCVAERLLRPFSTRRQCHYGSLG